MSKKLKISIPINESEFDKEDKYYQEKTLLESKMEELIPVLSRYFDVDNNYFIEWSYGE